MSILIPYSKHDGRIIDVDLNAPPEERWLPAAEEIGDKVTVLMAHVDRCLDEFTGGGFLGFIKREVFKDKKRHLARMVDDSGADFGLEIHGLAEAVEVDPEKLIAANIVYDLLGRFGAGVLGCSSASFVSKDGHPVLARTLDWGIPSSVGENTIVVRYRRGKQSYLSIAPAGFVGVLSAMRPKQWAMTLNYAPPTHELDDTMPVCSQLRDCCDASLGYSELVESIRGSMTASPFFAHVVGTTPQQRCSITGLCDETHYVPVGATETLAWTNHHQDPEDEDLLPDPDDDFDSNSLERLASLNRRVARGKPSSFEDGAKLLNREPITWELTQQAMVLCPATGKWDLKIRPDVNWRCCKVECPYCKKTQVIKNGPRDYDCDKCGEEFVVEEE